MVRRLALPVPVLILLLFTLPGCLGGDLPNSTPPRFLYYEPRQENLVLSESEELDFIVRVQSEYRDLDGWSVTVNDSLVARSNQYRLRPLELANWPRFNPEEPVHVEIALQVEGMVRSREWWVEIQFLNGAQLIVSPVERELIVPAGLPILFQMELLGTNSHVDYRYTRDDAVVSTESEYFYPADRITTHEIEGRVFWVGDDNMQRTAHYSWLVTVVPGEDQEPPTDIEDLRIGPGPEAGDLIIAFTPPEDDDGSAVPSYEVRAFYHLIPFEDWDTTFLLGLLSPEPGLPEQRLEFSNLEPGRDIYLRVKSYDGSGNHSQWSNLGEGKVRGYPVRGQIRDFETGDPIGGLQVSYVNESSFTDEAGGFYFPNVEAKPASHLFPPGLIRDETVLGLGEWFDMEDYRAVGDSVFIRLGSFRVGSYANDFYEHFLDFFRHMVDEAVWGGFALHPSYPITVHVPLYENESGVQYWPLIHNALDIWNEDSGLELFTVIADSTAADLNFVFHVGPKSGNSTTVTQRELDTHIPLRLLINIKGNALPGSDETLQKSIAHELGHAIGLMRHSSDVFHLMSTSNTEDRPDRPAPAELRAVRILYHMSLSEDMSFLVDN